MRDARFNDTELPSEVACPHCSAKHEKAMATGTGSKPGPTDWSICIACLRPSVFQADLTLRKPTADELEKMTKDEHLIRCIAAAARARDSILQKRGRF